MTARQPEPDGEGFAELWPTPFLRRRLPGHEAANQALLALIEELEARNRDLTTDYRETNLLGLDDPAARWLKDCANKTAIDYLKRVGLAYPVNWRLQGWANVNRRGDYHDPGAALKAALRRGVQAHRHTLPSSRWAGQRLCGRRPFGALWLWIHPGGS